MPQKSRTLRALKIQTHVFGSISAEQAWTPSVNVYECGSALYVCVELAGVRREALSVAVQDGRLIIDGRREVPDPESASTRCIREMEIDHGLFRRVLSLPDAIDLKNIQSEYRDGLLWIMLPLLKR